MTRKKSAQSFGPTAPPPPQYHCEGCGAAHWNAWDILCPKCRSADDEEDWECVMCGNPFGTCDCEP